MGTVAAAPQAGVAQAARPPRVEHRFVIFMLAFWSGWVAIKFANVQFLEMYMLLHGSYLIAAFLLRGLRARIYGFWIRPGIWFGCIMAIIFAIDLSDLRIPKFVPQYGPVFIEHPLLLLVARYIELFIVVFYSIYAAELMRRDPRLRYYAMKTYALSACISAWYTILSIPLSKYGEFFGYYDGRGRGGFTEGGPWGLYLVTACIVGRALWVRRQISRKQAWIFAASMAFALVLAASKAAAACALAIFLTAIFLRSSWRERAASLVMVAAVATAGWYVFDIPQQWQGVLKLRRSAELIVRMDPDNPSTAYGRVAASVIVPRMIGEHWLTGIGWGNYPIVRNNPQYLGIMLPVKAYDLPGLGLVSEAAELGFPALIAMYVMMFYPVYLAMKTKSHRLVAMMGLAAPVVFMMGAQFTLFYPWMMTAFALSFLPLQHARVRRARVARPALPVRPPVGVGVPG